MDSTRRHKGKQPDESADEQGTLFLTELPDEATDPTDPLLLAIEFARERVASTRDSADQFVAAMESRFHLGHGILEVLRRLRTPGVLQQWDQEYVTEVLSDGAVVQALGEYSA